MKDHQEQNDGGKWCHGQNEKEPNLNEHMKAMQKELGKNAFHINFLVTTSGDPQRFIKLFADYACDSDCHHPCNLAHQNYVQAQLWHPGSLMTPVKHGGNHHHHQRTKTISCKGSNGIVLIINSTVTNPTDLNQCLTLTFVATGQSHPSILCPKEVTVNLLALDGRNKKISKVISTITNDNSFPVHVAKLGTIWKIPPRKFVFEFMAPEATNYPFGLVCLVLRERTAFRNECNKGTKV